MNNIIFILIYAFLGGTLSPSLILSIFSFHCILLLLPYFGQKKLIINPISLYILGVLIVNIADIILIGNVGTTRNRMYKYIVPEFIDISTQIWCISCTFTYMGYELANKRSFPPIDIIVSKKKSLQSIFYTLLVINLLQLLGFRLLNIGQILKFIGVANLIGILFFARLWAKTKTNDYFIYWVVLFFIQTYIALFSYLRINLILPSVVLCIGYFIGKEDMKYLLSYRAIPFLVIFILYSTAFKTLGSTRSNFVYAFLPTKNDDDNLVSQKNDYAQYNNVEKQSDENKGSALLDRTANIAQLTCVVNLANKNGFYNGRVSEPLIVALVPRFLWPGKPQIAIGRWFAVEIGVGYVNEAGAVNNSINMTIPGELYLDFGWIGVVLGSLLLGAFFAAIWNASRFYSSEYNIAGILFGGNILLLSFIGFGVDLQIIITVISTYLTFLIVKRFVKVK